MLEGKHVIGLFVIILLFSALFFSLGFKMGQSQYDGNVFASPRNGVIDSLVTPRPLPGKRTNGVTSTSVPPPAADSSDSRDSIPGWGQHQDGTPVAPRNETAKSVAPTNAAASKAAPVNAPLANAPSTNVPKNVMQQTHSAPAVVKNTAVVSASHNKPVAVSTPLLPAGSYTLQVAALKSEADALDLANNLRKRKFQAFVLPPQGDKFYRVQVGPFADQKAADAAKKGLDAAGFKAIVKH